MIRYSAVPAADDLDLDLILTLDNTLKIILIHQTIIIVCSNVPIILYLPLNISLLLL